MKRPPRTIVFAGPTLSTAQVKTALGAEARCEVRPPAAQGDVWRALAASPRVIVLIDGVFESRPSVWHREILDALDNGVTVFGAASMGALRAVELAAYGMIGVGEIFRAYRDRVLIDDAEVALLHADAEHGHRALTLPLVQVRHAAALAKQTRVLTEAEAQTLIETAEQIFYHERHWPRVRAAVETRWPQSTRARWDRFAKAGFEDVKAKDALECLVTARQFLAANTPPAVPVRRSMPSHVRARKAAARSVGSASKHSSNGEGLRTLALASWARSLGFSATAEEIDAEIARWWGAQQMEKEARAKALLIQGLDAGDVRRLAETRVLATRAMAWAERLSSDGPSRAEGDRWERSNLASLIRNRTNHPASKLP